MCANISASYDSAFKLWLFTYYIHVHTYMHAPTNIISGEYI